MSAELPQLSAREAIAAFEHLGFSVLPHRGKGHTIMAKPGHAALLSIPNHRQLKRGTLRSLLRDAGIGVTEFVRVTRGQ